jgi:flagellum-specific peptidoglycan hydrolase FlgJ
MKQLVISLMLAFLFVGCGTKKRTTYSKKDKKNSQVSRENPNKKSDGLYPLPEDTGKFQRFNIGSIEEYIATFNEIAKEEMKAFGIPASITLAQGILESGFGRGALTLKTNNHFGIKCHNGWDGDFERYDDDAKGECFRKYNHPMYSYRDHSIFLSSRARYASLFDLRQDNYKGWAKGLKAAGYATDRKYPQKLISFIDRYELYKFDKEVLGPHYKGHAKPKSYTTERYIVRKGDTLYSISRRYFVSVDDIMKLNKMKDSTLSIGQEIKIRSER